MRKIFLIAILSLCIISTGNAQDLNVNDYKIKIEKILPSEWKISKISERAVPYNLTLLENEKPGILFEFTGPTIVLGPRGYNKEKESFSIWIMPANYSGTESEIQAQFYKATLLGSSNEVSIYIKTFVSDIPTWKDWEEDLIELFKLKTL